MDQSFLDVVGKYGLVPTALLIVLSRLFPLPFRARANAAGENTRAAGEEAKQTVIELLTDRVAKLEASQSAVWAEYAEERRLRMAAEDKVAAVTRRLAESDDEVSALKKRVAMLEAQIRSIGGTVA